jgi:hypothetical protein
MVDCVICDYEITGKKIRVKSNGIQIASMKDNKIWDNGKVYYCCEKCYNRNFK